MADVFISYKSERRPAAKHLAETLTRHGYSVWYDYALVKGRDFSRQIDREIRAAKALVVLWCSRSVQSEWVLEEVDLAKQLGILVPVKIESCDLPVGNRLKQYVDLQNWDGSPRSHMLDPLLDAIAQLVGNAPQPDFNRLREYEATWRSFGAPTLARCNLEPPLEVSEGARHLCVTPTAPGAIVIDVRGQPRAFVPGNGRKWFTDYPHGPEMVVVPPGSFMMGSLESEPGRSSEEGPQHEVTLANPFAVARHAVTRGQFAVFVNNTSHKMEGGAQAWTGTRWNYDSKGSWRSPGFAQDDSHPVVCINFDDAKAYAAWLTQTTGKSYRLLTDAEREYVTRAGSATPFWWGDTIATDQANYNGNYTYSGGGSKGEWRRATVAVGSFAANPWGLYEVHGNVWEWCEDPASLHGANRVLRGGSWVGDPQLLRAAYRCLASSDLRKSDVGFRLARTLLPR